MLSIICRCRSVQKLSLVFPQCIQLSRKEESQKREPAQTNNSPSQEKERRENESPLCGLVDGYGLATFQTKEMEEEKVQMKSEVGSSCLFLFRLAMGYSSSLSRDEGEGSVLAGGIRV